MKVLKAAVVSAVMLSAITSAAQATDQVINLSATVPSFCTIAGSGAPAAINQTIPINPVTFNVDTTAIPVGIGTVICNKAANVQLTSTSGALLGPALGGANPALFQHYINYGASLATPIVASVNANSTTGSAVVIAGTQVTTANATSTAGVTVTINPTANALPLIASGGTPYTDTLTVSISPTP